MGRGFGLVCYERRLDQYVLGRCKFFVCSACGVVCVYMDWFAFFGNIIGPATGRVPRLLIRSWSVSFPFPWFSGGCVFSFCWFAFWCGSVLFVILYLTNHNIFTVLFGILTLNHTFWRMQHNTAVRNGSSLRQTYNPRNRETTSGDSSKWANAYNNVRRWTRDLCY